MGDNENTNNLRLIDVRLIGKLIREIDFLLERGGKTELVHFSDDAPGLANPWYVHTMRQARNRVAEAAGLPAVSYRGLVQD